MISLLTISSFRALVLILPFLHPESPRCLVFPVLRHHWAPAAGTGWCLTDCLCCGETVFRSLCSVTELPVLRPWSVVWGRSLLWSCLLSQTLPGCGCIPFLFLQWHFSGACGGQRFRHVCSICPAELGDLLSSFWRLSPPSTAGHQRNPAVTPDSSHHT